MLLHLDAASPDPLFEQIAAQVRRNLADGTLSTGDRLPAARERAAGLGVNMHTVLRAYRQLVDEGLVEMRRSRGVVVTATGPKRAELTALARRLVAQARRAGLRGDEIRQLVEDVL